MSLSFALLVTGPAYGSQQATSAWQFANALIEKGHRLESVFFYREGVHNANSLVSPASDEFDLVRSWRELSQRHSVALNVCVAAALRRGVMDAQEAERQNRTVDNLQPGFRLSGLGELAQAMLTVDRVIQF